MVILDTNIFIHLTSGQLDRAIIASTNIAHPSIVKIEALGYSLIKVNELQLLEALFEASINLPLTDAIVNRAVKLRQSKKMGLGDSIVAATALQSGYPLWTENTKDFSYIDGLSLFNPMESNNE